MRMSAPVVGPAWLILARVGLAAAFLFMVGLGLNKGLQASRYWRHYLVLGFFNSALPFLLFAYAAQTISASLLSILHATAPIWAAAIAAIWQRAELTRAKVLGMAMGLAGVAVSAGIQSLTLPEGGMLAIGAALAAAFSYGIATNYTWVATNVEAFSNAHGSMWAAALVMVPVAPVTPFPTEVSLVPTGLAGLTLGIVCSGVAYLILVFGTLWGVWLLAEPVTPTMVLGGGLVLAGTALATGFSWRALFGRKCPGARDG